MSSWNDCAVTSPPVRPGFGEQARLSLRLARDFGGGLQEIHRRHGPVVDVGYGPTRSIFVFGPEANRHVLSTAAETFEWGRAMQPLIAVDGPTAVVVSDGDEHRRRRRLVQPAFSKRQVDARLDTIVSIVDSVLDDWRPGSVVDAHQTIRAGVRRIVVRSLFGERLGDQADRFGAFLEPALRYVQRNPVSRFDVDLRVNAYGRAQRGCREADAIVRAEVARRRAQPAGKGGDDDVTDTLGSLLAGVDGETLTEDELLDQVRSLVAAGYDTTAAAAAWLVVELGRNEAVFAAVCDEVRTVLGDRPPAIETLRSLPLVTGAVSETLRLWPAGFVAPRWSIAPSDLLGFQIPADRLVLYSPYVTGRMPDLWPDPDQFDPTRWGADRPDPDPYAFVTFGGGARRCLGFAMATLELHVLAVRLAQRVTWRLRSSTFHPVGLATVAPRGGVPIEIVERR